MEPNCKEDFHQRARRDGCPSSAEHARQTFYLRGKTSCAPPSHLPCITTTSTTLSSHPFLTVRRWERPLLSLIWYLSPSSIIGVCVIISFSHTHTHTFSLKPSGSNHDPPADKWTHIHMGQRQPAPTGNAPLWLASSPSRVKTCIINTQQRKVCTETSAMMSDLEFSLTENAARAA